MKQFLSKQRWANYWRESKSLVLTVLILTAVRSAIADWNDVPSGSMNPTIVQGDRVFVNKLAYDLKVPFTTWHVAQWSNPKRGDIVVFFSPVDGTRLVKRVVGVPGDRIELVNDRLFLNGRAAQYEPLSASVGRDVPPSVHGPRFFAAEKTGENPRHAVTVLPLVAARRTFGPVTVPGGEYFMMGDNRDDSYDSRFWGAVERERIVGRASLVVLSLDRQHYYAPRWNRFFTGLF
ncbi:MAG: signal peptidase I [Verrucomicrobiota bacterium]|jgi:signal peptidase I